MLRDELLRQMEAHFGADRRRIDHALRVLGVAEELMKEVRADSRIVVPAAILHDVGIKPAEEKYGSAPGRLQEEEGPPVARAILETMGAFTPGEIEEICAIVAHHHSPGYVQSPSFAVVYDADCVVNLAETAPTAQPEDLRRRIEKTFLTEAGKKLALRTYVKENANERAS